MKSEHRHELQTNELSKLAERASAGFDQYYNQILFGMCAILLVTAGWVYWTRSSAAEEAAAWADVNSCQSPEEYADVAKRRAGTKAATWAKLHEGDGYLSSGIQSAFANRETSVSELDKARKIFEELAASRGAPADVRERAQFGLAKTLECLAGDDVTPAVKAYETLLKDFPNTVYKSEAEERKKALNTSGTQSFYAWFHKQNPKPDQPAGPNDTGPKDDAAGDAATLPDIKNIFDVEKALQSKPGDAAADDQPSDPSKLGEPPTEGKPADKPDSPQPEKPEPEKPAAEKTEPGDPKTEKPAPEDPDAEKPKTPPADEAPSAGAQPDKNEP